MPINGRTSVNKDAKIELLHIQLELRNNRYQHLRHFIDQYYCYQNNLITKGGRAAWEKITWSGVVSKEASKLANRRAVVKEHVVPICVITEMLRELTQRKKSSLGDIKRVLDKFVIFGTISKGEDDRLNKKGLRSKMPKGFYKRGHKLFGNLYARYVEIGLKLRRSELSNYNRKTLSASKRRMG